MPIDDLTATAQSGAIRKAIFRPSGSATEPSSGILIEQMSRGLFRRRSRHVLVTGQRGVGKPPLVAELAGQAKDEAKFKCLGKLKRKNTKGDWGEAV